MYQKTIQVLGQSEPRFLSKKSFANRENLTLSGAARVDSFTEFRPDRLAYTLLGDSSMMELLMDVNNIADVKELKKGKLILYPINEEVLEWMRIFKDNG